ncbi:MAG: hypothetical protein AMXMBFR84_38570 [Candidatus Hydrogenedentota bacterium]
MRLKFVALVCASILVLCGSIETPATAHAQGFTKSPPVDEGPGENLTYYNGDTRLRVRLSYEELQVTPATESGGAVLSVSSALPSARVEEADESGSFYVNLGSPGSSKAELQAQADSLVASGYRVHAVLYPSEREHTTESRMVLTNQVIVQLKIGDTIDGLTSAYPVRVVEKLAYASETYILEVTEPGLTKSLEIANDMHDSGHVLSASPSIGRIYQTMMVPNDTFYPFQWHLKNPGTNPGSTAGYDVNIESAWDIATGEGVRIGVVDDGLQTAHEDLAANVRTDIDIDIAGNDLDPNPTSPSHGHGTSVSGVAAAVTNNSQGVAGAGFDAELVGIRLIVGVSLTDAQIGSALSHRVADPVSSRIYISSNSWGFTDSLLLTIPLPALMASAINTGITQGRGGLGTIYVKAAGNGRFVNDNINKDGFANSRFVIAVGATGGSGLFSQYSEPGSCMFINAPSNYGVPQVNPTSEVGITTTDLQGTGNGYDNGPTGNNNYTQNFGGTSSATPLVSGIIALILEANPNLTWRDVQHILADTAFKNDPTNADWQTNDGGYHFNHNYGFGRIDAAAAVTTATAWQNVPAEATPLTASLNTPVAIPDSSATGVSQQVSVSGSNLFKIEHVIVTVNISHTSSGNLAIKLTGPGGTVSQLMTAHNDPTDDLINIPFTSVAHWGENPNGNWTLTVSDLVGGDTGTLNNWSIKCYGYIGFDTSQPILNVVPLSRAVGPDAGTTTFDVSNGGAGTVNWSAAVTSGNSFASIQGSNNGTNSGSFTVAFLANTTTSTRTAEVTISAPGAQGAPRVVNVIQSGAPVLSVTPSNRTVDSTGGSTTFSVTNTGGGSMPWTAQVISGADFVSIPSGGNGTNSGTINVEATANPNISQRQATIRVTAPNSNNGQVDVTVTQPGRSQLNVSQLTLNFDSNGGQTGVDITNTGAGALTWQAAVTSGLDWLTATPASGAAPSLTNIVAEVNASTTPRVGTVQISATGALNAPQTITVNQAGCDLSAAPQNLQATDGTFTDRIRITYSAVPGATQYWIYRAVGDTLTTEASQVIGVTTTTTFDDFDVLATTAEQAAACGGGGGTANILYHYAVSAVSVCGEGAPSVFDSGFRGIAAAKSLDAPTEWALPSAGPASASSSLSIRVRAHAAIDPFTVAATADGVAVPAAWIPASTDGNDGWVRYTPETPLGHGTVVTLTVSASDVDGNPIAPTTVAFQIADGDAVPAVPVAQPAFDSAAALAQLTEARAGLVDDHPLAVGSVFVIEPQSPYDEPQPVWLPVPAGVTAESARVYYHVSTGDSPGWYPVDEVAGLLASPATIASVDGQAYIGLTVRHGGPVQVTAIQAKAAAMNWGGLAAIAAVLALLAVAGWHQRRAILRTF